MEEKENITVAVEESAAETPQEEQMAETGVAAGYGSMSIAELIEALKQVVEQAADGDVKEEINGIKVAFYKRHKANMEKQRQEFLANGGNEEEFLPSPDESEGEFKKLLEEYKRIKADIKEKTDKQLAENLAKKQEIIKQLQELIENEGDVDATLNRFHELIREWREIGEVPSEVATEVWKVYNQLQEKFYDLIKINHELREYDFKKNLELKSALCEKAENLVNEKNVLSAFQQLQVFHEEWKNVGPVAKEFREDIWNRFKAASTAVNKRYQQYFEDMKAKEVENLKAKEVLCERVEGIDLEGLKDVKGWDVANELVLQSQKEWKSIGFAPRKYNLKVYERFRSTCDRFFKGKSVFFATLKSEYAENLRKKEELCAKVEAALENTNWEEATKLVVSLQKEWKEIGPVSRRYSEAVWKRFSEACDVFFAMKKEFYGARKDEELRNLEAKRNLIERVKEFTASGDGKDGDVVVARFMKEWEEIGHVPFKEKERVYSEFKAALDEVAKVVNKGRGIGRDFATASRAQLVRRYEGLMAEIRTIENNLGFFKHSKGAGGMMEKFERNVERLKEEAGRIATRLDELDKRGE